MIAAMAMGHRVLGDELFLSSAERAARFVLETMVRDGRLLHSYREGKSPLLAYLDDYSTMLWGLIELYEATFDLDWLRQARRLADQMIELFRDEEEGGFSLRDRTTSNSSHG